MNSINNRPTVEEDGSLWTMSSRPLAVVTGASSGIGFELARLAALNGFDLIVAADHDDIKRAAQSFASLGANVRAVTADLSKDKGIEDLDEAITALEKPVSALFANAGRTLGEAFIDQGWPDIRDVIDTNILGTVSLIHKVARDMRERGRGRILITGSIAGFAPGAYQAVYNASKAFLNSFAHALRAELKHTGVTVTCLMPGITDTPIFGKGDMANTLMGKAPKDAALMVAHGAFTAMMRGDAEVIPGIHNRAMVAGMSVLPAGAVTSIHAELAKPRR